ncbi:MAG TPA: class I SAM-dependent methyltransferase [Candidatus Atribacteria bacterium]|nr:class I SAM-dependent methyltransferase [Candidatus Atribacteria bacterium]
MYEKFAYVYDALMQDVDYDRWVDFIEDIFKVYGAKPETIVDLACGTGNITGRLAERGYKVTGIDISGDMLAVASEKARNAGLDITYVCQDMRELELHRPVDAITCMCDGFNYILEDADLEQTLSGIKRYLNPGGILVFDTSSHYKLSRVLGNNVMTETEGDINLIWCNTYDKSSEIVQMNLTFFVKEENRYRKFEETHFQRAYKQEDMIRMLEKCGFSNPACFAEFSLEPPRKKTQRIFYAATNI